MENILQITIKEGNLLAPYEMYAIKTNNGELAIGYYSESKKIFRTNTNFDIALDNIIAYANLEELQDKMNAFGK